MRTLTSAALVLVMAASVAAQVSATVETREATVRAYKRYDVLDQEVMVPDGNKTEKVLVGYVQIDEAAGKALVKASYLDRTRVPVERVPNQEKPTYLIFGKGKVFVEVILIDELEWLDFPINIGPDEPDPEPGPDPEPDPDPDVPDDEFNNIGKRVAIWARGLDGRKEAEKVYRDTATMLRDDQKVTVNDAAKYLVSTLKKEIDYDSYQDMRDHVNAELQERWPMDRGSLADYFDAVANGLGAGQ